MLRSQATGVCLLTLLAACATGPTPHSRQNTAAEQRSACLTATGTRLPLSPGQCAAFGESYSGKDLQQTGKLEIGPALQMLDPSITVHH
ncbi:MAG: hypothetical protein ACREU6_03710 [Steroidobacteraceae bacterium]